MALIFFTVNNYNTATLDFRELLRGKKGKGAREWVGEGRGQTFPGEERMEGRKEGKEGECYIAQ